MELSQETLKKIISNEGDKLSAADPDLRRRWIAVKDQDNGIFVWKLAGRWMYWISPEDVQKEGHYFADFRGLIDAVYKILQDRKAVL